MIISIYGSLHRLIEHEKQLKSDESMKNMARKGNTEWMCEQNRTEQNKNRNNGGKERCQQYICEKCQSRWS